MWCGGELNLNIEDNCTSLRMSNDVAHTTPCTMEGERVGGSNSESFMDNYNVGVANVCHVQLDVIKMWEGVLCQGHRWLITPIKPQSFNVFAELSLRLGPFIKDDLSNPKWNPQNWTHSYSWPRKITWALKIYFI